MGKNFILLFIMLILFSSFSIAIDTNHSIPGHEEIVDVLVFYGDGCPHCTDLEEYLDELKQDYDINVILLEVYHNDTNRDLAKKLAAEYGDSFRGVPMTFIGDKIFIGYSSRIGENILTKVKECLDNCCDSPLEKAKSCQQTKEAEEETKEKLTIGAVISLAVADSINPCALAVLTMALVALLSHDPTRRKRVLYGGLAFTSAVFFTYIFYGFVIIQFFKSIQTFFTAAGFYVRIIFAALAILLGLLNVKDYFSYQPGSIGTEMPMFLRPIAKNLIKNITRPRGAFIIGILVTLFLLPCTIGPYVIVGNLLSGLDWIVSAPWLVFYNLIFILPMIAITLFVYFGYTTVNKVSGWKEENIKYLHLLAGVVLVLLGLAMLLGYI